MTFPGFASTTAIIFVIATGEQAAVLNVHRQPARRFAGRKRPAGLYLQFFGVEGQELALVFEVRE
jgi:hypothetical protein